MERTIDLRKKIEEKIVPPPIHHPVIRQDKVLTERGETVPYPTVRWKAPLLHRGPPTRAPYVVGGLLIAGGIAALVWIRDMIAAMLFTLLGMFTIIHARRPVPDVDIELTPGGIRSGDHHYGYDDIRSFWLRYEPERGVRELSLLLKRWYLPHATIQLADQSPTHVRDFLIEFIPEIKHDETLAHVLTRRLGL